MFSKIRMDVYWLGMLSFHGDAQFVRLIKFGCLKNLVINSDFNRTGDLYFIPFSFSVSGT